MRRRKGRMMGLEGDKGEREEVRELRGVHPSSSTINYLILSPTNCYRFDRPFEQQHHFLLAPSDSFTRFTH